MYGDYRLAAKKRLGQHFLVDRSIVTKLLNHARVGAQDIVLEVGPGRGALTSALARTALKVIAVEKDRWLAEELRRRFQDNERVQIIEGDVLKIRLPRFDVVVSTPPYNISSKLILMLLKSDFKSATMILQREFAERIAAVSGTREYGRLSVMFAHKGEVELLDNVSRNCFRPVPKVDSAIVRIEPKVSSSTLDSEPLFEEMVRGLFTQRRRNLRKAMGHFLEGRLGEKSWHVVSRLSLPAKRVYELSVSEFERLSNDLWQSAGKELLGAKP